MTCFDNSLQYIKKEFKQMSIDELNKINEELLQINSSFRNIFTDYHYKTNLLTKKHTATLFNKIYSLLELGSVEERIKTKQLFLGIYRSYVNNFVKAYIFSALKVCNDEHELIRILIQKWAHFKKFIFYYSTLFQNANSYYETAFKSLRTMGKLNKITEEDSVFPLSAIAIYIFSAVIYDQFQKNIHKYIRFWFNEQRQGKQIQRQNIRVLFQIIWCCGLRQTASIRSRKISPTQNDYEFFKSTNLEMIKQYENQSKNGQSYFASEILDSLIEDCQTYYEDIFQNKLVYLNPIEDFATVQQILLKEEERADFYFFSQNQKQKYLTNIKNILVLKNINERITKQKSLKYLMQSYIEDPSNHQEFLTQIKLFGRVLLKSKGIVVPILQKLLINYIQEFRSRINEKINKRKEYIVQIVKVKTAINQIIDEAWEKQIKLCVARDKCFRKILDTIQASRNLADFTDFKIKQCIKARLSDEDIIENFKQIFLVLQNLAATDSFLLYHQQLQAKRLIQSLNQPKIDIESMFLKIIAEKLGSISVSSHSNMIRDIQNSQQIGEKFNKLLPFSNFRWGFRIISQPFWPDNANKNRLTIELPQAIRIHAETVAGLYHDTYDYRYLNWKLEKGFSLFEGNFSSGKYRFQSQNIFLMILLHVSESRNKKILFGNLQRKVTPVKEGDHEYLMKCLGVLIQNNLIIRDNPDNNQQFTEGQQIKINLEYKPKVQNKQNQTIMIKVSQQMLKAMHKTSVEQNKILKERQKLIEAVLVKLLKHSHSMGTNKITFQELYKGIKEHSHLKNFNFSQSVVKQRLQELIARQYCQRDQKDRKVYHYIA